jgi:hypothetical protein
MTKAILEAAALERLYANKKKSYICNKERDK